MGRGTWLPTIAALSAVVTLGACGSESSQAAGSGIAVVTTTSQTADFLRVIGGTTVSATNVLAAGIDPHDFEPTPADLDALAKAKVVVINGLGLEPWFADAYEQSGSKATVVTASDGVSTMSGAEGHGGGTRSQAVDPHIWHDPNNAKVMVTNIAEALEAADPPHSDLYQANLERYLAELTTLDADIAAQLSKLTNRKLVTNHDAFGYFIRRYGLEFVGSIIPGFDTQAELSVTETNDLIDKIRAAGVKAVFAESSLPPKVAKAIADEAGVTVVDGDDALYGDSLGPTGSGADTYLTMMRHNAQTIAIHLS